MVPSATRPRYASAHFCCYLQYFVHVTSLPCRRNTRSRHFLQKNTMVSAQKAFKDCPKALETQMAPGSLLRASRELPESFLRVSQGIWVDILTKSEQNQIFSKNGHVQKIQTCQFLEKKPPEAQRQRQPGAFQKRPCLKTYLHKIPVTYPPQLTSTKSIHFPGNLKTLLFQKTCCD